jgi:hypothetical protein
MPDKERLMRKATMINAKGATREIVIEEGYAVVRLGNGWYQIECDLCTYTSARFHDWHKLAAWGRFHQLQYHKDGSQ